MSRNTAELAFRWTEIPDSKLSATSPKFTQIMANHRTDTDRISEQLKPKH